MVAFVLFRLAQLAADGLVARAQLEELRGDSTADQLIGRIFTVQAAVESGVIVE